MFSLDVSALKTNVIAESTEHVYTTCAASCAVHRFCTGINYKENAKENEMNCQLTNTTQHKFDENASKKDRVWTFRKVNVVRSLLVSIKNLF